MANRALEFCETVLFDAQVNDWWKDIIAHIDDVLSLANDNLNRVFVLNDKLEGPNISREWQ